MKQTVIILFIWIIPSLVGYGQSAQCKQITQEDFYGKWLHRGTLLNKDEDVLITITANDLMVKSSDVAFYTLGNIDFLEIENSEGADYQIGYTISGIIEDIQYYNVGDVGEKFEISFYINNNNKNQMAWHFPESGGFFRITKEEDLEVLLDEELEFINKYRKDFNLPLIDKYKIVIGEK